MSLLALGVDLHINNAVWSSEACHDIQIATKERGVLPAGYIRLLEPLIASAKIKVTFEN